jgi:hypothetical protein
MPDKVLGAEFDCKQVGRLVDHKAGRRGDVFAFDAETQWHKDTEKMHGGGLFLCAFSTLASLRRKASRVAF